MSNKVEIRLATSSDQNAIWKIIQKVIRKGDTYAFHPESSREDMLEYWCGNNKQTYVSTINNVIVGTFLIKDNFVGLGAHIANASYMTDPIHTGKGVGTAMGIHSINEAKKLGYHAMQFNIVVKSNHRAVKLWQKLGFKIIGESPDAFNHMELGLTNAYIMWRKL